MKRSLGPARRREVCLPVELTFDRSALRLSGESQNMSHTGMLILSEDPKPPGTPVRFRFDDFHGRSEVVWRREAPDGSLLGMRFTALGQRGRTTLTKILRESVVCN